MDFYENENENNWYMDVQPPKNCLLLGMDSWPYMSNTQMKQPTPQPTNR